jgi:type I restriction enzyme S subunit
MNSERLLQHFDRISEAPDAIPRLRRFILDLAVRGKLVEQDPNDEPAADLLKRIQGEKARLVKEAKIKQEKPIQSRANGSMPIELPKGWLWGCIQEICTSVTDGDHIPPPKSESGIPFLVIGDVRSQSIDFSGCRYVPDAYYRQLDEIRRPTKGDILYTLVGSYGIPVVVRDDRPFCVQRHIGILRPSQYVNVDCLARVLESRVVFDQATRCATGIAQKTVPLAGLRGILIPLPPLTEQHRIVAKVDELMALCDQLEAAKTEREQSRDRLVAASLHRLNSPADTVETDVPNLPAQQADAFRDHARFVFDHLPRLTTRPEHIKQLRQTILNLAVSGKLVPQDPNDEPAEELLKRLAQTKQQKDMQNRKGAKLQQLNGENDEVPFQIPLNWLWLQIGTLFEVAGGIQKTPLRAPKSNAFPYLGVGNVYRGRIDLTIVKEFELQDGELERWRLEVGDLLIIEGNGSLSEIGRCAVWNGEIERCVHQNHVIRCRPLDLQISPFVLQFLNSPAGMAIMQRLAITSSGLYSLSVGKIRQIEVPFPPLAEQHRIVARVDELMALCDQLEAQLTATEADSHRLLEAVLHEALVPGLEEIA